MTSLTTVKTGRHVGGILIVKKKEKKCGNVKILMLRYVQVVFFDWCVIPRKTVRPSRHAQVYDITLLRQISGRPLT